MARFRSSFASPPSFIGGALALAGIVAAGHAASPNTSMVSVATGGTLPECETAETFCYSITPAITPNARYVAFVSVVKNLVPGPQPSGARLQLFLHDRWECTTIRISQTPSGVPSSMPCTDPAISADGNIIAFITSSTNLVTAPGQSQANAQVFAYVRNTATFELISATSTGTAGNGSCGALGMSADGRYLAFQSDASNLVAGDTNGQPDIFIYDRQTDVMQRIVSSTGVQGNSASRRSSISRNGRYVAFDSLATNFTAVATGNLAQCYLYDRDSDNDGVFDETGGTTLSIVSLNSAGQAANNHAYWPVASEDGTMVAFATMASNVATGDTNGAMDLFIRHTNTAQATRESVGPGGMQTTAGSYFPMQFSADGKYMTFHSAAQQLVAGGHNGFTHIFRRDLTTGENIIISRNSAGQLADSSSEFAAITANGNTVAFDSVGYNMNTGGINNPGWVNVYLRSLKPSDLDGNDVVDVTDLFTLLADWNFTDCTISDINDDGVVNVSDLFLLLADWSS